MKGGGETGEFTLRYLLLAIYSRWGLLPSRSAAGRFIIFMEDSYAY
jgi:hypothetical protein